MKVTRRAFSLLAASSVTALLTASFGCDSPKPDATASGASPAAGASSAPITETPKQLVMGFTPAAEASKVADNAKPLAAFLSKELGIPVTTFTSTDYSGLIEAMGSAKVDIGMLPPLAYVLASDQKAATVLLKVRRIDKNTGKPTLTYRAMFVARTDSGIKKIEDAKGKRMAFVDPSSTSGYLFPAAYLKKKGYDPETFFSQLIYAGSHDKAVQSVYNGDVDIAACYDDARNLLEKAGIKDVKQKVSIVEYTGDIPNDTITVRGGLDPALAGKIKTAFKKYADSPEGKKVLFDLYEADGVVDALDSDYDPIREVAKSMDVNLTMFAKKDKPKGSPSPAPSASPAAK
jgi:phosphonate transport system substrate-binding protein